MSGTGALWGRETMGGMGHETLFGGGNRLDTEVGYGLPIGARFVGTPPVGLRTSEYGRDYRLRVEWAPRRGNARAGRSRHRSARSSR